MGAPLVRTTFLVPVKDNDGQEFPVTLWEELEQQLVTRFGGFSMQPGVVGAWGSDGTVYRDVSNRYEVALASWTQLPQWLDLVYWVRHSFRQVAVYIEVAGVPEVLEDGDG